MYIQTYNLEETVKVLELCKNEKTAFLSHESCKDLGLEKYSDKVFFLDSSMLDNPPICGTRPKNLIIYKPHLIDNEIVSHIYMGFCMISENPIEKVKYG